MCIAREREFNDYISKRLDMGSLFVKQETVVLVMFVIQPG